MKRLYKSSSNRIISGVCGGVGEYFKINPVTVRIIWFLAMFFIGIGILAYIAGMILIPKNEGDKSTKSYSNTKPIIGIICIILGGILLLQRYWIPISLQGLIGYKMMPGIVLITLGLFVILAGRERRMMRGGNVWPSSIGSQPRENDTSWRQIRRSRKERLLLGICGGIGERYQVDPVLIRLGWIGLIYLTNGFGILLYLLFYFMIPLEREQPHRQSGD